MRAVLLGALVVAVGCSSAPSNPPPASNPPPPPPAAADASTPAPAPDAAPSAPAVDAATTPPAVDAATRTPLVDAATPTPDAATPGTETVSCQTDADCPRLACGPCAAGTAVTKHDVTIQCFRNPCPTATATCQNHVCAVK